MLLCLIHKSMTIKPQTNKRDNRCSLARQRREKGAGIGGDYLHNKLLFLSTVYELAFSTGDSVFNH